MSVLWRRLVEMAVKNHIIWLILTLFVSLVFTNQAVFADNVSISISSNVAALSLAPGQWGTTSQTITASTTNPTGYTISLVTTGLTTDLVNQSDNTKTIPTFTLPSGSSSIPVNSVGDGYGYSLDGGANFYPAPDPLVSGVTIFNTIAAGSNTHTLTFGAKVPTLAEAGVYTNTFGIMIVANPGQCPAEYICYYGNGDDGTGTMSNQSAPSGTDVQLIPSNYSRPGYGFAGWNTAIDGSGTNYGPSETIAVGDLTSEGMVLYARWVVSAGNLQNWKHCGRLNDGDVIALTDTRDGNAYAIAKYPDGQCWLIENLRLDLSDTNLTITADNTNSPTTSFMNYINTNHPASSNNFCQANSSACIDQVLFNSNNTNRNMTANYDVSNNSSSWYSYGNYYNWYTATAGHGTQSVATKGAIVAGDICPAGWRLPTAYELTGDMSVLDIAMGGNGKNYNNATIGEPASARYRSYPYNYFYSGEQKGTSSYNRGISAGFNTKNAMSAERLVNVWIKADGVYINANSTPKYRGQTMRCLTSPSANLYGDIIYDSNGGTGTTPGETDVDFGTTPAAINQFTRAHFEFISWNTAADGSGTAVLENGSLSTAVSDLGLHDGDTLTLYAIWQPIYSLVYDGNNADTGTMASVNIDNLSQGNHTLIAPNFLRSGYGFAGWSLDPAAGTKLLSGIAVTVYGPNETVNVNSAFLANADVDNVITLYAVWLSQDSTYTMQTFSTAECASMATGSVIALRDTRDNNTYAVTKLSNGKCWMMENLRLNPYGVTFNGTNTNAPTADFATDAPTTQSVTTFCNTDTAACIDQVGYNTGNIDSGLTPSYDYVNAARQWYGYGVVYNWYTATAGNGTYSIGSGSVAGDICPAGWRLPTGGTGGEYAAINTTFNNGSTSTDAGLLRFPVNLIRSGDYNNAKPGGRGSFGRYWSATASSNAAAFRLGFAAGTVTPLNSYSKWDAFTLRCIAQ